jgi:hypothetical protein
MSNYASAAGTKPQFTLVTRRLTRHRARAGSVTTPCVVLQRGRHVRVNVQTTTAEILFWSTLGPLRLVGGRNICTHSQAISPTCTHGQLPNQYTDPTRTHLHQLFEPANVSRSITRYVSFCVCSLVSCCDCIVLCSQEWTNNTVPVRSCTHNSDFCLSYAAQFIRSQSFPHSILSFSSPTSA